MTEKEWQSQVVTIAKAAGWHVIHHFDSRRTQGGVPDLWLMKPPRMIFAELKTEKGKLQDDQRDTLLMIMDCGVEATLWRPSHINEVERVLIHGERINID